MKKLLPIGLIAGGLAYYFGRQTFDDYSEAFEQMQVNFKGMKNLKISADGLQFDTNLELQNPSEKDLVFKSGKKIILRKIRFYSPNGEYIGEAAPNIDQIELPKRSAIELKNIPTFVPLNDFGGLITNALEIIKGGDLKMAITLEAFCSTYTIEA